MDGRVGRGFLRRLNAVDGRLNAVDAMFLYEPSLKVRVVVTGISGFLGGHLGRELRAQGHYVVGADWALPSDGGVPLEDSCHEFYRVDLRDYAACAQLLAWPLEAAEQVHVFHCAGDAGGGRVFNAFNNAVMDMYLLEASRRAGVHRLLYVSSTDDARVDERCAEHACRLFDNACVVRLPAVYGPQCPWRGGRERVAAALCRKVAAGRDGDALELWREGGVELLYVDDAVEGLLRAMAARKPFLAVGTGAVTSVGDLARLVLHTAGKSMVITASSPAAAGPVAPAPPPRAALGWEPTTPLERGVAVLYSWVAAQVATQHPDAVAALRQGEPADVVHTPLRTLL